MQTALDQSDIYKDRAHRKYFSDMKELFDYVYDIIDVPGMSLFENIEKLREHKLYNLDPKMLKAIIETKLEQYFSSFECPICGRKCSHNRKSKRHIETTYGTISFDSPYYKCKNCDKFYEPYVSALNLRKGKYQYDVQKIVAKVASSVPFDETAEILHDTHGLSLSQATVHELTNELAAHARLEEISPEAATIHEIIEQATRPNKARPVLVFAADGAMSPTRTEKGKPNAWKEAKGIRVYLLDGQHLAQVLSWHQICDKHRFKSFLQQIKQQNLFPEDKVRICCIGDGAGWIWEAMEEAFPDARQILDYYHCQEHIHEFANARFADKAARDKWLRETTNRLFQNKLSSVLAGLRRMKLTGEVAEKRDALCSYLSKNKDRMDYGKAKRGGYPLGSGAIESANKFISHIRLKRSGAWWKVELANNILALRCSRYNKSFDRFFVAYEKSQRQDLGPTRPHLSLCQGGGRK